MIEWFERAMGFAAAHPDWMRWMAIASAAMFILSLLATPWLIALIPAGYFVDERPEIRPRWLRPMFHVVKNALGGIFLVAGIAMLVLPGQGLLTILVGILMLDFPGKRRLELALLKRQHVVRSVNWIRVRLKRPPLRLPDGLNQAGDVVE